MDVEAAMREAIGQARLAAERGELPYGAVVVAPSGDVVARAHDQVEADGDLTSHAELLAVRRAAEAAGPDLRGHCLVSTCEPCAMCFAAAWTARIDAVAFGLSMAQLMARHPDAMDEIVIDTPALNLLAERRLTIESGVLVEECEALWAPNGGRQPTSHEQREGRPWDASYLDGPAPWDTGEPQPAVVRLAREGAFRGAVLDAGCGTGENALHVASLGLHVLGVDVAETALSSAREKAARRDISTDFMVADALHLERLGRVFETVLDCGLFHAFDSDERRDYVASLASVTGRGGHVYVLCFSDVGSDPGPHPVSEEELRSAFNSNGDWSVASISPDRVETRFHAHGAPAWLAKIERI